MEARATIIQNNLEATLSSLFASYNSRVTELEWCTHLAHIRIRSLMAALTLMAVSNPHTQYSIWQCNCRSYHRKRNVLQRFLSTLKETDTPDNIALQESGGQAKLVGYAFFTASQAPDSREVLTTLVKRNIPVIQHPSLSDTVPHIILEILSSSRRTSTSSMFFVNVYSSLRQPHRFHKILSYVKKLAKTSPLLLVENCNALLPVWGYIHDTRKRRMLFQDTTVLATPLS
ncbi:hypothetical protein HPB51_008395 [Rhipicephalus microplus]|uniref:Tick transposon n=1 Tax=Rhipicephalus microplus TaxID=6941 RepID=A0A9J6DU89_RHIMP|nr:hypothetical protein HPB51_008395 [Rhipicephalus microplus]